MEELLLGTVLRSQEVLGEYVKPDSDKSAEKTVNELLGILDDEHLVSEIHDEYGQTIKWPTSGNVESTTYMANDKLLEVEFNNGGIYHYKEVPPEIWKEMKTAKSIGSFIHRKVKGSFRYEKQTP